MSNYWDQIKAIFKPYKGHVLAIFTIFILSDAFKAQNFTEESCMLYKNTLLMLTYLDQVGAIFGP